MKTPFDEDFETQQQQIRQLHLKLETQMQHFLVFIQQCQDNRSMLVYSPPEPPPHPAARYSLSLCSSHTWWPLASPNSKHPPTAPTYIHDQHEYTSQYSDYCKYQQNTSECRTLDSTSSINTKQHTISYMTYSPLQTSL